MGTDARGGERTRGEVQPFNVQVINHEKQESQPGEAAAQGAGAIVPLEAPAIAASARTDKMRTVLVDKASLCCSICSNSLNRPIYQCSVGHLSCSSCRFSVLGNCCQTCRNRGAVSTYTICPGLGFFFGSLHVRCPYEQYGCKSYIPYYETADHQSACEHAPCHCPEPGCSFAASKPTFFAHLTAAHSWTVHRIPGFGVRHALRVPASGPDRFLVVEEDACRVFVLSVCARGAAAAVSVACVRLGAEAGPRYKCTLWAHAPAPRGTPGRTERRLGMETDVASCAAPGEAAAAAKGMWLGVVRAMMLGESREIHLGIVIGKL